ncbi:hypothetical protein SAY87_020359 [Trapa incisa]|uniref:Pectinesterase n=1 Tax=Trapa incisa TaxID=236973 RepID=A0AAN7K0M7_9MYRT|nr:hypothetical protein SAY87_020359 [Trapa incisa]
MMEYCRLLRLSDSCGSSHLFPAIYSPNCRGIGRQPVIISLVFIIVISVAVPVLGHQGNSGHGRILASQTISRTCGLTLYPSLCVKMLAKFSDDVEAAAMDERDLVHISLNVTLQRFSKALCFTSAFSTLPMAPRERSAYLDCIELLDDSVDALSRSIAAVGGGIGKSPGSTASTSQDVVTWLSAAMTNQDTCSDGFDEVSGSVKDQVATQLRDLAELVSNCLAIFAAATRSDRGDFAGLPIQNRRRMLLGRESLDADEEEKGFPRWLGRRERRLLQMSVGDIQADIVVSKDGNGTCNTIAEAIKKAPENSARLTVIYVRAGRYEEDNLKVGRKKMNLMFIGDGKDKTIISGHMNYFDNITTFRTASFAATGDGFIARDMTFENWSGPGKHQAVALRVGADHAVIYRCNIIGYQDTLYVHSNRQFYRECDIYGTVDFIFGNAAVVLQNCSLYARKPMAMQKNTVTAQNRKDPNQNTGISIHACRILAASDLPPSGGFQTYLGRPWKLYSRTVYMQSYIGGHVNLRGWLEWNATFALDTLYYGEYKNYGPGAAVGQRVNWPGYRVISSAIEASKFTVAQFIFGSSWLPSTRVEFSPGLSA